MQDDEVPCAGYTRVGVGLADLAQHRHRAQGRWRDAAANISDNGGLAVGQAENMRRVDSWVDAANNHHVAGRIDGQKRVEAVRGESRVASRQVCDTGHESSWRAVESTPSNRRCPGRVTHCGGTVMVRTKCTKRAAADVCAREGFHCNLYDNSPTGDTGSTLTPSLAPTNPTLLMIQSTWDCRGQSIAATSVASSSTIGGQMPASSSTRCCAADQSGNKEALGIPKRSQARSAHETLSRSESRWLVRSATTTPSPQNTSLTTLGGSTTDPQLIATSTVPSATACSKSGGHILRTSRGMSGACRRRGAAKGGGEARGAAGGGRNHTQ